MPRNKIRHLFNSASHAVSELRIFGVGVRNEGNGIVHVPFFGWGDDRKGLAMQYLSHHKRLLDLGYIQERGIFHQGYRISLKGKYE